MKKEIKTFVKFLELVNDDETLAIRTPDSEGFNAGYDPEKEQLCIDWTYIPVAYIDSFTIGEEGFTVVYKKEPYTLIVEKITKVNVKELYATLE